MGRTSTNGVELFYEERNGGDPPIVFVHGWSCNHSFFAPQYDYLAGRHHVVALDLRGHGDSEVPVDGYSFATMADDVAGLCRALGLERPVLVGHSMGGAVTVELAARHRDLPRALVLVDPAPLDVTPDTGALLEQFAAQLAGPDALEQRRRLVDELLFLPSDDPVVRAQVVAQMLQPPDHVARQCFEAIARWQGAPLLQATEIPVLVVHAEPGLNDADALAGLRPGICNVRTAGVGHFNQLLAADEVNRLIDAFVADVAPAEPEPSADGS